MTSIIERVSELFPNGSSVLVAMDNLIAKRVKGKTSQEKLRCGVVQVLKYSTQSGVQDVKVDVIGKSYVYKLRFAIIFGNVLDVNDRSIKVWKDIKLKKRTRPHTYAINFPLGLVVCTVAYPVATICAAAAGIAIKSPCTFFLSPILGLVVYAALDGRTTYKVEVKTVDENPLFQPTEP